MRTNTAKLIQLIERAAAQRERASRLDEWAMQQHDPDVRKRTDASVTAMCHEATSIEFSCATAEVESAEGQMVRCHFIGETGFTAEELIEIAWAAGHDAGRLGLSRAQPGCFANSLERSEPPLEVKKARG
ncbi:hypothetical protein AAFG13_06135 [Bradyrhizobium sp. B124]|uniref:hypothetical protein n=1 Tax=Bradyrhizobium sp. B124 TaxID=3140245 RepID=UPI003182FDF2